MCCWTAGIGISCEANRYHGWIRLAQWTSVRASDVTWFVGTWPELGISGSSTRMGTDFPFHSAQIYCRSHPVFCSLCTVGSLLFTAKATGARSWQLRARGCICTPSPVSTMCCLAKHRNHYNFLFEFPCIITLYYIKNQQDATLAVLFISHCKITLHVSDAFCVHHQEY